MAVYSITKDPSATNVVALVKNPDVADATVAVTKNPGNETMTFQKNASTKVALTKNTDVAGSLVTELYPQDNAASITTELNATTGWTASGTSTFESSVAQVQDGSYAIYGVFNGPSSHVYFDLNTILTNGIAYTLDFWIRHSGVADGSTIRTNVHSTASGNNLTYFQLITNAEITYQNISWSFTHDSTDTRYFNVREASGSNNGGFYLDAISITPD